MRIFILSNRKNLLKFSREIYEKHQNQLPVTIYPGEWFEVVDGCRLNFNNDNQVLFPDQYGEHMFDKRTKLTEFLTQIQVPISSFFLHRFFSFFSRISTAVDVIFMLQKNSVPVNCISSVNLFLQLIRSF